MDTTDQPSSICHIQPIQMYTLRSTETKTSLPFLLLSGESDIHVGTSVDGLIVITNYRLYLQIGANQHHVPLGLIELVEHKDLFYLQIGCKDARTYRCTFENNESCLEWYDRLLKAAEPPKQLDQLFAFYYHVWTKEKEKDIYNSKCLGKDDTFNKKMFENELTRLQFEGDSWRISRANENYKLCPSYPPYLLVPSCINDEMLESVAKFRSSRRIPAAVWRHTRNGAVIARCSQPEVGWLGWRSADDEDLIKAISDACNFDRSLRNSSDKESNLSHSPGSLHSDESLQITSPITAQEKKVLIMDARSYTTAVANRARGGGCECPEYYPNCEIQFMNLANIHSIRKSFNALRQLCTSSADQANWFSLLEGTRWLLHMSGLMKAAVTLVTAIERDARPVLVHCSDGWDRTPQIVALAELLLDPYYRTIDGFRILIEREWLAFGHKFADRCGHSTGSDDQNERCPVFLQWLDCVHQLLLQFPCAFEFTQAYLVKLAQHTYSNLFGTFLCNTRNERSKYVYGKTFSVWDFLSAPCFRNHLYAPLGNTCGRRVLWPQCNVRDLTLWSEMYLGSMEANFASECGSGSCPGPPETSPHYMTKTRSFGDLINAGETCSNVFRRSSDPNINSDKKLNDLASDVPQESNITQDNKQNGHCCEPDDDAQTVTVLTNDIDDIECNNDCMFKNANNQTLTDDQIDGLDVQTDTKSINNTKSDIVSYEQKNYHSSSNVNFLNNKHVINGDKTEDCNDCELGIIRKVKSISINNDEKTAIAGSCDGGGGGGVGGDKSGDINHNSHDGGSIMAQDIIDSDTECSGSRSESGTMCDTVIEYFEKSIETSTDTIVAENFCSSFSSKDTIVRSDYVQNGIENNITSDNCKSCQAQNLSFIQSVNSRSASEQTSRNSTPPLNSRTSSSNGWDHTLHSLPQSKTAYSYQYQLGDDGLVPLRSVLQERLNQIFEEQKKKVELLLREVQVLNKQICQKCNHIDNERQDDNSDKEVESSNHSLSHSLSSSPQRISSPLSRLSSVIESVCSVGEGQASAIESSCSDMSWEALELTESTSARWVPDHAVKSCIRCHKGFWFANRKHHCRKCGNIFCADCSKNSTPLPSEQLFQPVRVCSWCYSDLRKDCGEPPNQCKQDNPQTTNNNPQITASSN